MPNRYTHRLDAIEPLGDYIFWADLDLILPKKISDEIPVEQYDNDEEFEVEASTKTLTICLIAELSDQDLLEMFGV